MSLESDALDLLKTAVGLYSPLASLIGDALLSHAPDTAEGLALADKIRAMLPERSATREALDTIKSEGSE